MMVPGSDLLADAFDAIDTISITYHKYKTRTLNSIGIYVAEFEDGTPVDASVQSVDRNVYKDLGLDWQKNYLVVYLSSDVVDIDRGVTGDEFVIFEKTYQIVSVNPWFNIDGWSSFIVVEIKPSTRK